MGCLWLSARLKCRLAGGSRSSCCAEGVLARGRPCQVLLLGREPPHFGFACCLQVPSGMSVCISHDAGLTRYCRPTHHGARGAASCPGDVPPANANRIPQPPLGQAGGGGLSSLAADCWKMLPEPPNHWCWLCPEPGTRSLGDTSTQNPRVTPVGAQDASAMHQEPFVAPYIPSPFPTWIPAQAWLATTSGPPWLLFLPAWL